MDAVVPLRVVAAASAALALAAAARIAASVFSAVATALQQGKGVEGERLLGKRSPYAGCS